MESFTRAGGLCRASSRLFTVPAFFDDGDMEAPMLVFWALFENLLGHGHGREGVRPAGIECEVRDHFRGLRLRQTVIHRPVEVARQLGETAGGDQRAYCHQAAIPRRSHRSWNSAAPV